MSASRSRTLWLGELEATAAARTGWTVAWPLRFFCDGPWMAGAARSGGEGERAGEWIRPGDALRFKLVCSEFQSVLGKLLPPVKFT